jgi:hypothetical protein
MYTKKKMYMAYTKFQVIHMFTNYSLVVVQEFKIDVETGDEQSGSEKPKSVELWVDTLLEHHLFTDRS